MPWSDFTSQRLTDFADFGFAAQVLDGGQVKVAVLVHQGDLPLGRGAALVQRHLHHLQLNVNRSASTHKEEQRCKRRRKRDSGVKRDGGRVEEVRLVQLESACVCPAAAGALEPCSAGRHTLSAATSTSLSLRPIAAPPPQLNSRTPLHSVAFVPTRRPSWMQISLLYFWHSSKRLPLPLTKRAAICNCILYTSPLVIAKMKT